MSNPLTDSYLADNPGNVCALTVTEFDEPLDNSYLRRIWRHAFMLAMAGLDNFIYGGSHTNSTVWAVGTLTAPTTARVFDGHILVEDYTRTSYEVQFRTGDNKRWHEWLEEHGGTPEHREIAASRQV